MKDLTNRERKILELGARIIQMENALQEAKALYHEWIQNRAGKAPREKPSGARGGSPTAVPQSEIQALKRGGFRKNSLANRIMDFITSQPAAVSPSVIADSVGVEEKRVKTALWYLLHRGWVDQIDKDAWIPKERSKGGERGRAKDKKAP